MSLELEGVKDSAVPSPAVNSAPANTPVSSPAASTAVDKFGFTAEDRAAAADIYKATETPLPPVAGTPTAPAAAPAPAPEATKGAVDASLTSLASLFGADLSQAANNDAAAATLNPIIDAIAGAGLGGEDLGFDLFGAGYEAPAAPPAAPAVPTNTTVADPLAEFSLKDEDLASVDSELAGVFKSLNAKQSAVLSKILAESQAANKAVAEINKRFEDENTARVKEFKQVVTTRANKFLDDTKRYGVAGKRTAIEQIHVDAINKLAGSILKGLVRYNVPTPQIEDIMHAALLRYEGKHTVAAAAPAAPVPIPPLAPRQTGAGLPAPARSGVGSTSGGDVLMKDADYLTAARAILAS